MNEILRSLHRRKSVRAYTDRPVTAEEKTAILTAAGQAPTAGNQQLYTILDIAAAPVVLVFLADCKKWYDAFRLGGCEPRKPGLGDLLLAVSDANIAAQNAVTAAESLGIGSCYIGDVMENHDGMCRLLHLPKYVFPAAMLVMGYPTAQQQAREKPQRCALSHIVHENAYRSMEGPELESMLTKNAKSRPYAEWLAAFCKRKYNSDFSKEMTRSVAQYCDDFRPD